VIFYLYIMTPNQRLDQLEPLMAESLQKIDRLIEGQGQILEIATHADQKADTTAKGLANLTVQMGLQFDQQQQQINELRQEMQMGFIAIDQKFDRVDLKFDEVNLRFDGVDQQFDEVNQNFAGVDQRFDEVNQKFDEVNQNFAGVNQKFADVDQRFDEVSQKFVGVDLRFDEVNQKIDHEIGSLRQEMNQRFDQLVTLIQERLK